MPSTIECLHDHELSMTVLMTPGTANFAGNVHVGELVHFLASVNHTGTSSMEIGIKVVAEDIRARSVRHVNSCYFTMVALGDDGKPVAVPPIVPATPEQRRRHSEAEARRAARRELERRAVADRAAQR